MKDKYINDIEPMIINWLKSGNENTTYISYLISEYIRNETNMNINTEPAPSNEFKYCNHHHKLTHGYVKVDFGDGEFVANKMAIPLLKALNELGLRTRTHHVDENGGFVSILLNNGITFEIREVYERDSDRTKYNGKTEMLISWTSKLPDTAKAGGQKTLKTVEQHEPRLNEPEQACFISHVSDTVCDNPHCVDGIVGEMYGEKIYCDICHSQTGR